MEVHKCDHERLLDELQSKWMLVDMKSKIIQTVCCLLDDQLYTKENAIESLLEIVSLIEMEEQRFQVLNHRIEDIPD